MQPFTDELRSIWFILTKPQKWRTHCFYFDESKKLRFIDIIHSLDTEINFFFPISIKDEIQDKRLYEPEKYRSEINSIRYLLNFKKWKYKFYQTIKINTTDINSILKQDIFKSNLNNWDVIKFLWRKASILFSTLYIKYIISYYVTRVHEVKNKFFWWKVLVFLWADWVGKSTIIKQLEENFWYSIFYLWFLNTYYRDLKINYKKRKTYQIIGKFILLYIKYLIVYSKIIREIFVWNTVLVDRYDRYPLWLNQKQKKIFTKLKFLYFCIPKSTIISLTASSKTIAKRKNELTINEIDNQNKEVENIAKRTHWTIIINSNLSNTLNKILSLIYT